MTLRIMLLGLVASMGFELPSGDDLSRWTQSGREWVGAQLADRSVPSVEAEKPGNLPTDCLQADASCHAPIVVVERPNSPDDMAFEAVTTKMAADFACDLIAKAAEPQPSEPEPVVVVAQEIPTIGLPSGEESACQVIVEAKVEVAEAVTEPTIPVQVTEVVAEPSVPVEVSDGMHERLDRISSAVRLTREAVQAWAEVIQDPVDETGLTR